MPEGVSVSIALFLDVDNTLTDGNIQATYARLLDCSDEYLAIERPFQADELSTEEFGQEITRIFSEHDFTESVATEAWQKVPVKRWTDRLLRLPVHIYFVSSGPSYFIRPFAENYGIPSDNVLCSDYAFDAKGRLLGCAAPVGRKTKRQFVQRFASRHSLSVGVGDSPIQDGPFLDVCDIPMLIRRGGDRPSPVADEYFQIPGFEPIHAFVSSLCDRPHFCARRRPRVFIASSSEAKPIADEIHSMLDASGACEPFIWTHDVFEPSQSYLHSLQNELPRSDFAVLLTTPDDRGKTRGVAFAAPRDNVVFELGLSIAWLGNERTFIVHPENGNPKLPSDLVGFSPVTYGARSDGNLKAALQGSVSTIVRRVNLLGPR